MDLVIRHLTKPRAAAIEDFFKTTSYQDLMGCYIWSQSVSAGLLPILGDFEIALRNAIHKALSNHYGHVDSYDWMMTKPNPVKRVNPSAKAIPSDHSMTPKTNDDIERLRRNLSNGGKRVVSENDIVANLSFGFWEQIISSLGKAHAHPAQNLFMQSVFPAATELPVGGYGSKEFKRRVVELLKQVRAIRNRVGHHDAIWSFAEFDEFGKVGFFPRRPRHSINSIRLAVKRIIWLSGWIDPVLKTHMITTAHYKHLDSLLSRDSLAQFRLSGGKIGGSKAASLQSSPLTRLRLRQLYF